MTMKIRPDFSYEKQSGYNHIAGIDEAGRGPLAGPVIAASIILKGKAEDYLEINDSKKLSKLLREKLFNILIEKETYAYHTIEPNIIDEINILNATKLAMIGSIKALGEKPEYILVDGNFSPNFEIRSDFIIKGDQKSLSIAAASIIAKVTRDNIMKKFAQIYPEYGFDKHMGYGTEMHINAVKKYGLTPIHRKSFCKKIFD